MDEQTGDYQFGPLKLLLWTAVFALLFGIFRMLCMGMVSAVCVSCWLLSVGIVRVRVAPKAAVMVSVLIGPMAVTGFLLSVGVTASDSWFLVLPGLPFGVSLGLILAGIVELAFHGVNWVEEFIQSKAREREHRFQLVLWVLLLSALALLFPTWRSCRTAGVAENLRSEANALTKLQRYEVYTERSWISGEVTDIWFGTPEGFCDAALADLQHFGKLESLSLVGTGVTGSGLKHLQRLPRLRSLNLMDTPITDAGLEGVEGLTRLEELSLAGTHVSDAGLQHLKRLTRLKKLFLTGTRVGDARLKDLNALTSLERLDLSDTQVTDASLESLGGLTALRQLSLYETQITDAGLEHLKRLRNLRVLGLNHTHVTKTGISNLQESLPECSVIHY